MNLPEKLASTMGVRSGGRIIRWALLPFNELIEPLHATDLVYALVVMKIKNGMPVAQMLNRVRNFVIFQLPGSFD